MYSHYSKKKEKFRTGLSIEKYKIINKHVNSCYRNNVCLQNEHGCELYKNLSKTIPTISWV